MQPLVIMQKKVLKISRSRYKHKNILFLKMRTKIC